MKSTLSEAPYSSNSHLLDDVLALSDVNHYAALFDWNSTGDLELIRLETQGGLQGEAPPQKDRKERHRRKAVMSLSIKEELGWWRWGEQSWPDLTANTLAILLTLLTAAFEWTVFIVVHTFYGTLADSVIQVSSPRNSVRPRHSRQRGPAIICFYLTGTYFLSPGDRM